MVALCVILAFGVPLPCCSIGDENEENTVLEPLVEARPGRLGTLELSVLSPDGRPGVLQRSTNLVDWSTLATVTNVFGTVQWNDTNGGPHRFYQAVEPPPPQ